MNMTVIFIQIIIITLLFTWMCFATAGGNNTAQIHNYPPEIQKEYFKTHDYIETEPLSRSVILKKSIALLVFALIFILMAYLAGARTFSQGFFYGLFMMVWIAAYDTFFMDWVLFANMKRFRLEGTEHMDDAYHQKWFHLKGILFPGSLYGIIVATITGIVISIL